MAEKDAPNGYVEHQLESTEAGDIYVSPWDLCILRTRYLIFRRSRTPHPVMSRLRYDAFGVRQGAEGGPVTTLGSWGPTLVLVVALLAASLAGFRVSRPRNRNAHPNRFTGENNFDLLRTALESAERINAYDVSLLNDPQIHLSEVVRLAPLRYQDGTIEIPRHYLSGAVVSVDLSHLTNSGAARLVDYCSGLLSGTSGWLFRATDRVIVLTPVRISKLP
jgi:hypothetical protein